MVIFTELLPTLSIFCYTVGEIKREKNVMGYFEELGKKIGAASKGAVKKASAFADSTSINVQINALSRERDRLFREIGAAYFEAYGTSPAPELTDLCCTAATKTAEIESLRRRLRQLRNRKFCPACQTECAAQDQFCASCGTSLNKEAPIVLSAEEIVIEEIAETGDEA